MSSPLPNARDARQDRSLRLWGGDGQDLLEAGHICLLGASSSGSEVLKNTVLPGLGRFTIVDETNVTRRDLGNNFFLEQSDEGKPKADALVRVIGELNPASKGQAIQKNPVELINNDIAFFEREEVKIVLVASSVPAGAVVALSKALEGTGIHIMYIEGNGLVGFLRIQCDDRYIIDAVPEPDLRIIDLRVFNPFPALEEFFEKYSPDDEGMEIDMHSHLPWPLIMYHALKRLRAQKNDQGFLPKNFSEWKELKSSINSMVRRTKPLQDNFEEAKSNATAAKLYVHNRNVPELKAILEDDRAANPKATDAQFWFYAHGLKTFKEKHGCFPVSSDIPDFTCTTAWYLELKAVYEQQQAADIEEVRGYVNAALDAAGRTNRSENEQSSIDKQCQQVCKHCWELTHLTFRPIHAEYEAQAPMNPEQVKNGDDATAFGWYVAHRAGRSYHQKNGNFIGACNDKEEFVAHQAAIVAEVEGIMGSADAAKPYLEISKEYVRYGGGEPVMIASIIGAVAAQEAIKLLQNKRVPVCDALVYDGIAAKFTTLKL